MKIFLTFDYELFFGESSGTVDKCMLEPTNDLLELARGRQVHYTFFVDVGYLIAAEKYQELLPDVTKVTQQVESMISLGHDVQLHIHPHWEKATFQGGKWQMNLNGSYRLSDFPIDERKRIVLKYKAHLEKITGRKVKIFRAGGWCVQPFEDIKDALTEVGIFADSSVIPGDYLMTEHYVMDFRNAPFRSSYSFDNDVCVQDDHGSFTEYPITSMRYSPLFFWKLYVSGRLWPSRHKMIGDGSFVDQGARKQNRLTRYTYNHVSTDGFFAGKLGDALVMAENRSYSEMVVIGHPKGNTAYALEKLDEFIAANHTKHQFITFHEEL